MIYIKKRAYHIIRFHEFAHFNVKQFLYNISNNNHMPPKRLSHEWHVSSVNQTVYIFADKSVYMIYIYSPI